MRAPSVRAVLTALLIVPCVAGCASGLPTRIATVRQGLATEVIHEAVPVMVDTGLDKVDDVMASRRLERLVQTPEVKALQKALVAGMVESTLATLGDQKRVEQFGGIAASYANRMVQGIDVKGAFGEETQERLQTLVGGLVHASVTSVVKEVSQAEISPALARAMTEQIGPAMQKVLQDNIGPALGRALDSDDAHRALGGMARTMGREMILGANEGLVIIQKENKERAASDRSLLGSVSLLADKGANVATIIVWAVGGLALLLAAAVGWLLLQRRRDHSDAAARTETTRLLGEAIRAADGKPWSDDLLAALESRFQDDEEAVVHLQAERARRVRRKDPRPSRRNTMPSVHDGPPSGPTPRAPAEPPGARHH